ncbi:MAG: SIS domain-containing protein [Lactobacillus sp.]|uniref:KpsF/GutQ family sugar-phosphate isomerase n=1 Tax=Lactobacillus juensis TaxID=3082862 RepID=UPI00351A28A8|nr:SIS domain-containing protein [Lactobacillus sp.]
MTKAIETMKRVLDNESEAIEQVNKQIAKNMNDYQAVITACQNCQGRIIFMGVGKTGHIGQKLAATFSSLGIPSLFVHAVESMHGDLGMITKNDIVIILSNSGETKETLAPIKFIKEIGAKTIAMTGGATSTLAKECDYKLIIHVKNEADNLNLAPTSSSTAELAVGDALACALSESKNFTRKDFASFHPNGALGKELFGDKS